MKKTLFLLVFTLVAIGGFLIPSSNVLASFTVSLTANPSSGNAPLNSTLEATISGSGVATYRFKCKSEDSWHDTYAVNRYTCNYSSEGTYTAEVKARNSLGVTATDTTVITVSSASCNDTDGGINKLIKGTCTDVIGSYEEKCLDSSHVEEYFCSGGFCLGVADTTCPASYPTCKNGACIVSAPPSSFTVTLTANPSSGNAPLNSTLEATISGSGVATYRFKCKSEDSWHDTYAVNRYTCNYSSEGTYTAEVKARNSLGVTATDTAVITVSSVPPPAPSGGECDSNSDCSGQICKCDPNPGDGVKEGKCVPEGSIVICNPLKADTFQNLINNIMNFVFWIAMALTPLMIIIGGIYFLFAGGEPAKIEKGKKIIIYTLIGFTIVLLGKAIIGIIKSILGG